MLLHKQEPRATGAAPAALGSCFRSSAFQENATRLAGLAGALAGWRPDEFWRATPAELEAVLRAFAPPETDGPPDTATIAALKEQFPDG